MTSGVRIKMDPTEKVTKVVGYVFVTFIRAVLCHSVSDHPQHIVYQ